ncbi:MAG: hypothetical protein P4L59_09410 [Desulfosporosinus sp.]|nr:hypothetical protein [Desulfosporosinus sp.]
MSTLAYAIVGLGIIYYRKKRTRGINIDLSLVNLAGINFGF